MTSIQPQDIADWSAEVLECVDIGTAMEVNVQLHSSRDKFTQRFVTDGTLASLRTQVRAAVMGRDDRKHADETPAGTVLDLLPDPAEPPILPTKEELARDAWLADVRPYQQMQKSVKLGCRAPDDPEMLALADRVRAGFRPEYEGTL
ncbi:MAG: hypothetical protein JWL71_680 [Acidobacteria bacterium]|nr:hypothetical protein [Acidobacteriota bacterium]